MLNIYVLIYKKKYFRVFVNLLIKKLCVHLIKVLTWDTSHRSFACFTYTFKQDKFIKQILVIRVYWKTKKDAQNISFWTWCTKNLFGYRVAHILGTLNVMSITNYLIPIQRFQLKYGFWNTKFTVILFSSCFKFFKYLFLSL